MIKKILVSIGIIGSIFAFLIIHNAEGLSEGYTKSKNEIRYRLALTQYPKWKGILNGSCYNRWSKRRNKK